MPAKTKKALKKDVHLVLSPKAARILDYALEKANEGFDDRFSDEALKIIKDIRKQIREFATDPK